MAEMRSRVAKLENTIYREHDLKAIIPPAVLVDGWEGRPVEREVFRAVQDEWLADVIAVSARGTLTLREMFDAIAAVSPALGEAIKERIAKRANKEGSTHAKK